MRCLIHYLIRRFEDRCILRTGHKNISTPRMLIRFTMHPHTKHMAWLYEDMDAKVLIYTYYVCIHTIHTMLYHMNHWFVVFKPKMRPLWEESHFPANMALCPFLGLFVIVWKKGTVSTPTLHVVHLELATNSVLINAVGEFRVLLISQSIILSPS